MLTIWYALTTFVGAALLFVVEPFAGRQLLPMLGGAPAVWITCVLFFQAALLAGYAYAHVLSAFVPRRLQPFAHGLALAAAWLYLPLQAAATAPDGSQPFPILWLLVALTRTLGAPFVVTSATAPLVQAWLGRSTHRHASDPYFLYAASNAGSLLALLAYPIFIEPNLALGAQARWWSWGFAALTGLLLGCGTHVVFGRARSLQGTNTTPAGDSSRPNSRAIAAWVALAAIPSSLMLGVTTFATTDIAPVPLLWVAPLALYLLTFILAFAKAPWLPHATVMKWLPFALGLVGLMRVAEANRPVWLVLPAHLAAFFVIALACHGELARTRPHARSLTVFYLVLSIGGVVGSAFNAVAAPLLFSSLTEYPLALVAAAFVPLATQGWRPDQTRTWQEVERAPDGDAAATTPTVWARALWRETAPAAGIAAVLVVALIATRSLDETWRMFLLAQLGAACVAVALVFRSRPLRFGAAVAALLLAPVLAARTVGSLYSSRSFFSVHRVVLDSSAHRHLYIQGTTVHGLQSTIPSQRRTAGAYYHHSGPAHDALVSPPFRSAGMIGLGVGSLASYAEPGQHMTFFEIDPDVAAIAENPSLFSFLHDARQRGATIDVVLGDARLTLARVADGSFDLLVLDAYSSDGVPVHLLTREALSLYRRKLSPGGRILMNMSNRYLDLGMVVSTLAKDMSWTAFERLDLIDTDDDRTAQEQDGKAASRWFVLAESSAVMAGMKLGADWRPLAAAPMSPWTDDYVNVIACFRWQ